MSIQHNVRIGPARPGIDDITDDDLGLGDNLGLDENKTLDVFEEKEEYYTVRRGYENNGEVHAPGDLVPVTCRNCALWNTETPGLENKLCYEGRDLGGKRLMEPDKWSCGQFFISLELKDALLKYLSMDVYEVQYARRLSRLHEKRLKFQDRLRLDADKIDAWFESYKKRNGLLVNTEELQVDIDEILYAFEFPEQLKRALPFFYSYAASSAKYRKRMETKARKFEGGDWVEWTDRATGNRTVGIIRTNGAGEIKIASADPNAIVSDYTFRYREWKANCNPKHFKKKSEAE